MNIERIGITEVIKQPNMFTFTPRYSGVTPDSKITYSIGCADHLKSLLASEGNCFFMFESILCDPTICRRRKLFAGTC